MRAALPLLAAALAAKAVYGAGFTTHMVVAHRALQYLYDDPRYPQFQQLLLENIGAVEAGAPYPDYLYECGANHDDGEFSHWSPFHAFAANYSRAVYPQPWRGNANATRLFAFIAGAVSHYLADISWHGLAETPPAYGLIETIGGTDFNCTGPLAGMTCNGQSDGSPPHSAADTGGEFVAAYATALGFDDPTKWYIPLDDLLGIYNLAGRPDVTAGAIEECAAIFFAGSEAIKAVAGLAEPLQNAPTPTLGEIYVDLPCGGLDDMAIGTGRMWQRWAAWVEQGPPPPPYPDGEMLPPPSSSSSSSSSSTGGSTAASSDARAPSALQRRRERLASHGPLKAAYRLLAPLLLRSGHVTVTRADGGLKLAARGGTGRRRDADTAMTVLKGMLRLLEDPASVVGRPASAAAEADRDHRDRRDRRDRSWTAVREADVDTLSVALTLARALNVHPALALASAASVDVDAAAALVAHVRAAVVGMMTQLTAQQQAAAAPLAAAAAPAPLHSNGTVVGQPVAILASTTPLEYAGKSVAVGDFDGDGYPDLLLTAYGHSAIGSYSGVDNAEGEGEGDGIGALLPQSGGFYVVYGNTTQARRKRQQAAAAAAVTAAAAPAVPEPLPADFGVYGTEVYTRLGWSSCVVDWNCDGIDDVAVSAPAAGWTAWAPVPWAPVFQYPGAVHVYYGGNGTGLASNTPDVVIAADANLTFLGMHLQCADVSGDGWADLLIGSPHAAASADTVGDDLATQRGRLDVFYNTCPSRTAARDTGTGTGTVVLPLSSASLSANGSSPYGWYGHHTEVVANASTTLGITEEDVLRAVGLQDGARSVPPRCAGEWAAVTATVGAGAQAGAARSALAAAAATATVLMVSEPNYRTATQATVGRVSAYVIPPASAPLSALAACVAGRSATAGAAAAGAAGSAAAAPSPLPSPLFTITGDVSLKKGGFISSKSGISFSVGYPAGGATLAVGMPNVDLCNSSAVLPGNSSSGGLPPIFNTSAGAVLLVPLTPALRGDLTWLQLVSGGGAAAMLSSRLPDSRYGWHVGWADVTGDSVPDLLVSAPQYTTLFIGRTGVAAGAGTGGNEAGSLLVYSGAALPRGQVCAAEGMATWRADGAQPFGRLGATWQQYDYDGDGTLDLVVAAPRASEVIPPSATAGAAAAGAGAGGASARRLQAGTDGPEMGGAVYIYNPAVDLAAA